MPLVPKVMSTQHPDNATPAPFPDDAGVLRGDGEVAEAVHVFGLGCDEQMWDSEGKEADNQVVRKLLTGYPDVLQNDFHLGRDGALTLRVANPRVESDMCKSTVEALQSLPPAWDTAQSFYSADTVPPIQEVILSLTTSAEEVSLVEAYYRKVVVGQEDHALLDGKSVKEWVGKFPPKRVRVIPLIEDMEGLLHCDSIVENYDKGRDLPFQRVFFARSDPALNYGIVAAELILKEALLRLHALEVKLGLPLFPIIGAGSAPFRGHLNPLNVQRVLTEYPSARTFTVQSAFKYDYDEATVRAGIAQIRDHQRGDPVPIDPAAARQIIDKTTVEYQARVQGLAGVVRTVSAHVPKRRERKMHVGLFGYGRSLDGVGEVTLPRAIGFAASLYSIGVPPELLGLASLTDSDLDFLRHAYPSMDDDLRSALRFANERLVKELLGDAYLRLLSRFGEEIDRVHEGLTSAIWAGLGRDAAAANVVHYLEEAAHLRRFLG